MSHSSTISVLRHYLTHQSLPATFTNQHKALEQPSHYSNDASLHTFSAPSMHNTVLTVYAQLLENTPHIKLEDFLESLKQVCEKTNTDYKFSLTPKKARKLIQSKIRRQALEIIFNEAQQKKLISPQCLTKVDFLQSLVYCCEQAHKANKGVPFHNASDPSFTFIQYQFTFGSNRSEGLELTILLCFDLLFNIESIYIDKTPETCTQQLKRIGGMIRSNIKHTRVEKNDKPTSCSTVSAQEKKRPREQSKTYDTSPQELPVRKVRKIMPHPGAAISTCAPAPQNRFPLG